MATLFNKLETTRFVCEPFHSDFMGQLTLNVLGNHLLNCAGEHAQKRGFGMARLNEEDHTWVLSRMAIEFEELPKQYESFEIDTWVESVYRLFTDRNFAIRNQEGRTIGYARTVWAMIGVHSRKPIDLLSMHDGHLAEYVYPEMACPIEKPGHIKVHAQVPTDRFTARYNDIDINGHVNSIRYIEHVMDLFPLDYLREHPLRRFEIAYVTESYYGDTLDIYADQKDNEHQIEIKKGNATICRCKLFFA